MFDPAWLTLAMGRVVMGRDDPGSPDDEQPSRVVSIGSLRISESPITKAQWRAFVVDTGYRSTAESEASSFATAADPGDPQPNLDWRSAGDLDDPVVHVSWFDAVEFCRWAGARLPTEAEWAYVASLHQIGGAGLWQWCSDWYDPVFHRSEQRVNPVGPIAGTHRVARGGSRRGTQRLAVLPDLSAADLSFRVVAR